MAHDPAVMPEPRLLAATGLSLERLETFLRIADAGGITAAAGSDPNRQSQFSRQLKQLETFFGATLARRGHGAWALTPAGETLHRLARLHFAALEDLRRECAEQPLELRFGAGESLLQWHVLPRLGEISRRLPRATWTLENCRSRELVDRLSHGRLDFALLRADAVPTSLSAVPLGPSHFHAVAPASCTGEELPRESKALLRRLAAHPLALLHGSTPAAALESHAHRAGLQLRVVLRATSYAQLAEATRLLGCATLLPSFALPHALSGLFALGPLPLRWKCSRTVMLVWNPQAVEVRAPLKACAEILRDLLQLS